MIAKETRCVGIVSRYDPNIDCFICQQATGTDYKSWESKSTKSTAYGPIIRVDRQIGGSTIGLINRKVYIPVVYIVKEFDPESIVGRQQTNAVIRK